MNTSRPATAHRPEVYDPISSYGPETLEVGARVRFRKPGREVDLFPEEESLLGVVTDVRDRGFQCVMYGALTGRAGQMYIVFWANPHPCGGAYRVEVLRHLE